VLGRIDPVVAAREHRDGAGGEARPVGGGIDAACEPRRDAEARGAELARQSLRHLDAGRRGVAGTDHGDQRATQHVGIAAHRQQRWGVLDGLEIGGIIGLAERDEARAEPLRRRNLALGLLPRAHPQRPRRAAAPAPPQ